MFFVFKKCTVFLYMCILLALLSCSVMFFVDAVPTFDSSTIETIVIDPGHGGNDPGAIGTSGSCEKDINLSVALALKELAGEEGFNIEMTRSTDVALYDSDADNKKRSDLKNRKKIIDNVTSSILVSIHMNKYEDASVKGAQTFYASTEESKTLAECVQKSIQRLDGSNRRVAMKTPRTVYLLQSTKIPSILVEGGFLSNPAEERKLLDKTYQKELAKAILEGIKAFLDTSAPAE